MIDAEGFIIGADLGIGQDKQRRERETLDARYVASSARVLPH